MARLTVAQDMKLGSALDQLEDAIKAAHASLKMVRWAQVNVARYVGGIRGSDLMRKSERFHWISSGCGSCRKSRPHPGARGSRR
jgi:hypothetical protein